MAFDTGCSDHVQGKTPLSTDLTANDAPRYGDEVLAAKGRSGVRKGGRTSVIFDEFLVQKRREVEPDFLRDCYSNPVT